MQLMARQAAAAAAATAVPAAASLTGGRHDRNETFTLYFHVCDYKHSHMTYYTTIFPYMTAEKYYVCPKVVDHFYFA